MWKSLLGLAWGVGSVGCASDRAVEFALTHEDELYTPSHVGFDSLLRPIDIAVGRDGAVLVADDGDKRVKTFTPSGTLIGGFGGEGDGPGEFRTIRAFTVTPNHVIVMTDRRPRLQRWSHDGHFRSPIPYDGLEEVLASLGERVVLANDPTWSLGSVDDRTPLARVVDPDGQWHDIGRRKARITPFAAHVANFVLPAASKDSAFLWLANLNDPVVERLALKTGARLRIARPIPWPWRAIPSDFDPRTSRLSSASSLPFDQVSADIDVDRTGRAYVLTPAAVVNADLERSSMTLDVIDADRRTILRTELPVSGNRISVADSGNTLYVLDTDRGTVAVLRRTR